MLLVLPCDSLRLPQMCRTGGNDRGRRFPACPQGVCMWPPQRLVVKGAVLVMSSERQRSEGPKRSRGAFDRESPTTATPSATTAAAPGSASSTPPTTPTAHRASPAHSSSATATTRIKAFVTGATAERWDLARRSRWLSGCWSPGRGREPMDDDPGCPASTPGVAAGCGWVGTP